MYQYERENRMVSSRCLKTTSDGADSTWRQVVPDGGTRNRKRPLADCRDTSGWNFHMMRGGRPQSSSGCHVGKTGETRL